MENFEELLNTLKQATSQHSPAVASATKALQDNEGKEGFHYALLKVALSSQNVTDLNVRWIAVLCLKNGIERHWRSHGLTPITESEKQSIKNEILSCVSENVQQVALQFAVIVSKIARYDFPKTWPNLVDMLLSSISHLQPKSVNLCDNTLLLTFRYVMKELSSKQLPNDRKIFREICQKSFDLCFLVWEQHFQVVVECIQNHINVKEEDCLFYVQKLINILKIFRPMPLVLSEDNFGKLFDALIVSLQSLLNCFKLLPKGWMNMLTLYHKLLLMHSKIFLDSVELENRFIARFANNIANLNKQCIFAYSANKTLFQERFIVNCINIMKAFFSTCKFDLDVIQNDELQNLLSQTDLESWEEDAEEFCSEEIGETWKYNLRPSTEVFAACFYFSATEKKIYSLKKLYDLKLVLFLTLLHFNSKKLVPVLLSTLETVNENAKNDSPNINNFLISDTVFTAIGLACNELFDCLDFESWFTNILLPYVQKCVGHPSGKIVHRRVLWLIEQWTGAKPPNNIITTLYEFITSSLERSLDIAVRLSAASALRQVLDDFDFDIAIFTPYQERCTDALYFILEDTSTGDAKMRVLHVLSFVIERLGPLVASCANKLALVLPSIWQASESHNMLRCAVVATLVNVVTGLHGQHDTMLPFLTNVIHTCTDISSPAYVYLLPDGLDLWLSVLHNTEEMNESHLQLFNNIYGLLELSSESLKECLDIIESYVLLGGEMFLGGRHGSDLALAISSLITDVRDECLVMVARLIETMLKIAPTETPFVFQQYLRDTIQHVLCNDDGTVLATSRLLVVSRLAFQNTAGFWNLFTQQSGQQSTEAVLAFLKVVCDRIDSVVDTGQRKLVALASLTLLERFTDRDALQRALSCALSVCIQVLYDVCDENRIDTFMTDLSNDTVDSEEWETRHSTRARALIKSEPNYKISLPAFTRTSLEKLSSLCGGVDATQQLLTSAIGNDALQELREFLR